MEGPLEVPKTEAERDSSNVLGLAIVISCAVIALACILSATVIIAVLFMNMPW